ncbi:MAG: molybdenum cofactor guanylyltransferase [Candidatus Obscuribacterales bacterium]|nr:molybdenum cofactor guanylyltransferase [Candidatus Obscuribacterales bacterium]
MPESAKAGPIQPLLCGILSGGMSRRMGQSKDSIVLPDGRMMAERVIDAMLSISNEIVIAGPELPLVVKENERLHYVKDNYPGSGPLSGIEAILASGRAKAYLIAACDQPFLNPELMKRLIPKDKEMPSFFDFTANGYIQPFPGYYPLSWLPEIRDSLRRNRRAIKSLIADSDVALQEIDEESALCLQSINTPEELSKLLQDLSGAKSLY